MTLSFINKSIMRKIVIILSFLPVIIGSCRQNSKGNQSAATSDMQFVQDTVIVKKSNALNNPIWGVLYSKSYSYYWVVANDTMDLILNVTEYEKDSTFSLRVFHKDPILFSIVLEKIKDCFSLIEEDFDLSKSISFNFKAPIYYLDIAKKMSSEYEQKFGRKTIDYAKLNNFLLSSSLTSQLNHFLNPLNKKVEFYRLEKFFLIEKKYYEDYLKNVDFTEYPDFTFNAHTGISVEIENK